ncbi:MAG: tRNA (adenosine(37)-N6)-threonylcarbamoyltransferase complex dimerization subunit type 1 TsaB [Bdellovibrionales bacterium]|nr:tRNA (adenosine(37)-N6)-threonylcarbamoyltransferase complex dimerization subunit type 1 TsaB [Bdellovibrionales bacterium]
MFLLSVDTSSVMGSLSIVKTNKSSYNCLSQKKWTSDKNKQSHDQVITVFLQEALQEAGISLKQLKLIICGVGPGSFTGIRVSVNFAKSLAFSLKIPIVQVSSLESLAYQNKKKLIKTDNKKDALLSLVHAFSKKIYLASYCSLNFSTILKKQVINYDQLEDLLSLQNINCWHISGDAYPLFKKYFSDSIKEKFKIYPKIAYPCSLNMIELFLQNSEKQKNTLDWKGLMPLYIRSSSAEELLNKKK